MQSQSSAAPRALSWLVRCRTWLESMESAMGKILQAEQQKSGELTCLLHTPLLWLRHPSFLPGQLTANLKSAKPPAALVHTPLSISPHEEFLFPRDPILSSGGS